jgi:hypothetical protein
LKRHNQRAFSGADKRKLGFFTSIGYGCVKPEAVAKLRSLQHYVAGDLHASLVAGCRQRLHFARADVIDPPETSAPAGGRRFEFDAAGERRAQWSVGGLGRAYFEEDPAALFSRTI